MNIRKRGSIITHEKRGNVANTKTISLDTSESLGKELESCKDGLSTAYMAAQPMQYNITVTRQRTKSNSNPDHVDPSYSEHLIQANQTKDIKDRRARQKC